MTNRYFDRYFDFPDARVTLLVTVKAGSTAALATPERIRDHFKQKGVVREIDSKEYTHLTDIYKWGSGEEEKQ